MRRVLPRRGDDGGTEETVIRREACRGCRDDVYNGQLAERCWMAKGGRMVTRYRIDTWTSPLQPGAYTEVRVPSCYHRPGDHFHEKPHPEAVDVVRIRRRR